MGGWGCTADPATLGAWPAAVLMGMGREPRARPAVSPGPQGREESGLCLHPVRWLTSRLCARAPGKEGVDRGMEAWGGYGLWASVKRSGQPGPAAPVSLQGLMATQDCSALADPRALLSGSAQSARTTTTCAAPVSSDTWRGGRRGVHTHGPGARRGSAGPGALRVQGTESRAAGCKPHLVHGAATLSEPCYPGPGCPPGLSFLQHPLSFQVGTLSREHPPSDVRSACPSP